MAIFICGAVAWYQRGVARDDDIRSIVELGRRTRKPTPRWLWIAALVIGVICAAGFAVVMLGERAPPDPRLTHRPATRSGFGIGFTVGAGAGVVIGFAIGRHVRRPG